METVREILARHGFSFKKQFGQNFITDTNLLRSIVDLAGTDKETSVLEIGCGAGTLTREIAAAAKSVLAFEIDEKLAPILRETLRDCPNAKVVFRDFLKTDLKSLEQQLPDYTVIANLPYYITSPLVMKFIDESDKAQKLVIMVQDDVAKRFCARENTPEYGAITAAIALKAEAEIVKSVPRRMFFPVPNVDSAVVKLTFRRGRLPVKSEEFYKKTVRCAFANRRKTLENNLVNSFTLTREEARGILAGAGVPDKARGETLSPESLAKLSDILYETLHRTGKA